MATVERNLGAARYFTEQQLGGPTRENESNPTAGVTQTSAVGNNGDRVGLIIVNQGANDVFIALAAPSATNGIRLSASGGNVSMNVRDDFTLPARQWFMIAPTGSSAVYVLEEISETKTAASELA